MAEILKCGCMLFADYSKVRPSVDSRGERIYCVCGIYGPPQADGQTATENLRQSQVGEKKWPSN